MNIILKRIIFGILIIINCIVIFSLSNQNAEKSSQTSSGIVEKVVDTVVTINKNVKKESIRDKITFYVRKTAHFSIYAILGVWLFCEMNTFKISMSKKLISCLLFGVIYATSDEFHQSFIGGRSQEIRDVCIDTCGVLFGSIVAWISSSLIKKIILIIKSKKQPL